MSKLRITTRKDGRVIVSKPRERLKVGKTETGRVVVEVDAAAREAKLDVATRLQRRKSQKVRVVKKAASQC